MSRPRRYFESDSTHSQRGPSDEMLAVDAATELRSLTLLYERYADRLYRYFLLCTADPTAAERLMRDLIARLPTDLQRFAAQDRSFAGWLFTRASEVFWQEYSVPSRLYRRVSRFLPARGVSSDREQQAEHSSAPVLSDFDEIAAGLREIPPDSREVLAIHFGARLKTAPAAEALRLPASLMSSHVQWALEALSKQVDASSTRRLSDDLSDVVSHQAVSSTQRKNHFALIHGVFLGDVELEPEEQDRAPIFEIGALVGVVIVGLIGIWIWGMLTEGDTRQHEVASPPPAVETASEPDPTPTPTVEPEPTPEPTPETMAAGTGGACLAVEGKSHFDRFVSLFNTADFEGLEEMLPGEDYESPMAEGTPDVTVSGTLMYHDGHISANAEAALEFLQERYEAGERWDVLEAYPAEHYRNWHGAAPIEMYLDWKRQNPGLSLIIVAGLDWTADDADSEVAHGRVVIDCDAGVVIGWDLQSYPGQGSESVSADGFVSVMDADLEPGEVRTIRARVTTDHRPNGGALSAWELTWSEAESQEGGTAERADVRTLDGGEIISYVNDGDRWRIDQRGWLLHGGGDDSPPLPDEIELAVPWLREAAHILGEFEHDLSSASSITINEDYSYTASPGSERWLEIGLQAGNVSQIRLLERTPNGERVQPDIYLLGANRSDSFDPNLFDIEVEPRFPELEVNASRYEVPDSDWDQLDLVSMTVGGDQASERYQLRWNDVDFELIVQPSRGGLDPESVPTGIDESWTTSEAEYRWGTLVWAHRHFAGYPTDAIWDDGRFRYVITVDRDAMSEDHDWDLDELIQLADALSVELDYSDQNDAVSGPDGPSDSGRGSVSSTARPS